MVEERVEKVLLAILEKVKTGVEVDKRVLNRIISDFNRGVVLHTEKVMKRQLYPHFVKLQKARQGLAQEWELGHDDEAKLLQAIRMKPRRTASGVATITVMTKPWQCGSSCIYCPNDVRMPKSYLTDEPVCQRAERNFFDPYLQVSSRLKALNEMGHHTDKIELIILGGTFNDYPERYQIWYINELFRALNDFENAELNSNERRKYYTSNYILHERSSIAEFVKPSQERILHGESNYNTEVRRLYQQEYSNWHRVSEQQCATWEELTENHKLNEVGAHRVVGLVIETRPDLISVDNLLRMRRLGCTKIQIGIQSLDERILVLNKRNISVAEISRAFTLLRIFGFKIHAHFMVNLLGQTPVTDKADYSKFVTHPDFMPDEVKLYPCGLIDGTELMQEFRAGRWQAYSEDDLVDVLVADTLATPRFCRISRMIRDFSSHDIVSGNKKGNLRQVVEQKILEQHAVVNEIRMREVNDAEIMPEDLQLKITEYSATAADEFFLEWVTKTDQIAGFLRLSFPRVEFITEIKEDLPVKGDEAMIREIHIYGNVAKLNNVSSGGQHLGLGSKLIDEAVEIARSRGFNKLNVISSVGTREYYRRRGFFDNGLYQQKAI
ncbi:MAG: tRNA uridine(34) 5-carboxymethylaminomethyl modification radical SAM/GNAT enzyme Elp3 [Candidatus Ancillula sp.]|jgi:elongator complex protein 3|nr:tRNA uridine(34) 5-carboxymethylaminomethyl modification radical SAM/GNAT enzyme Elp3 [Candidatus Ancillula sp.]